MKGSLLANHNRERVRLRQVMVGRTHLTCWRVTRRQVPLKFKGLRLYTTDKKKSSSTGGPRLSHRDCPLDDAPRPVTYRVSAVRRKDSSAGAHDYRPEMIDNPDTLRVTKSRRALPLKKKREKMGNNGEERWKRGLRNSRSG